MKNRKKKIAGFPLVPPHQFLTDMPQDIEE
jgi:hypothetical protein